MKLKLLLTPEAIGVLQGTGKPAWCWAGALTLATKERISTKNSVFIPGRKRIEL